MHRAWLMVNAKKAKHTETKKSNNNNKKSLIGETRAESAHRLRLGGCQSHDDDDDDVALSPPCE